MIECSFEPKTRHSVELAPVLPHLQGSQIVELPYVDGTLAFDLLLPEDPAGLSDLESTLNSKTLEVRLPETHWTKGGQH